MIIENAQFTENGEIISTINGTEITVPDNAANRHRIAIAAWEADGNTITPYAPPAPTKTDIRTECQRRLMALVGARDPAHLAIIKSNGQEEAIRLLRVGVDNWSDVQAQRAAVLEQIDDAFEAIRAKSNSLESLDIIPEDYTDDRFWQ